MNPPTRQKLIHHRPLSGEHVRILLEPLLLRLARRQFRAGVVDRLVRGAVADDPAAAGSLQHAAGGVRGRSEFVGFLEEGVVFFG